MCVEWIDANGEQRVAIAWAAIPEDEEQVEGIPILNVDLRPQYLDPQGGQEDEEEGEANCRYYWMEDSTMNLVDPCNCKRTLRWCQLK